MQPNWNPKKAIIKCFIKQKEIKKEKKRQKKSRLQKKLYLSVSENFNSCWLLSSPRQKTETLVIQRFSAEELEAAAEQAVYYQLWEQPDFDTHVFTRCHFSNSFCRSFSWTMKVSSCNRKTVKVKSALLPCIGGAAFAALAPQQKLHWRVCVAGVPCQIQPISCTSLFLQY